MPLPRSGLELGKSAATRLPDPHGKTSGSKPTLDAAKRMAAMRDRSRAHVMAGKAVGAHNAGGSSWAAGNDKVKGHIPRESYYLLPYTLYPKSLTSSTTPPTS
jgi:hypothetical protein